MTILQQLIVFRRTDDLHLHFRDGPDMHSVAPYTARRNARGLAMPNLVPPVRTGPEAMLYKERISASLEQQGIGRDAFEPLMTIYLTDETTPEDIRLAKELGVVAAKLYPVGATTNSAFGVTDIRKLELVFRTMEEVGMVLSIHGETLKSEEFGEATRDGKVSYLDREAVFLKATLQWIVDTFTKLKIVLEHITTKEAVEFVMNASANVAATITAHHPLATIDDVIDSHHNKCLPIPKQEVHRQALRAAMASGNRKFFAGTDSAPHSKSKKDTACGCAGCFTALHSLELYATIFEELNALEKLEAFVSQYGAEFYGLPLNEGTVTLRREEWEIPKEVSFGDTEVLVPFWAGKKLQWKFVQEAV